MGVLALSFMPVQTSNGQTRAVFLKTSKTGVRAVPVKVVYYI